MSYLGQNTDAEIDHALRSAIATDSERSAIEILDRLHGVGVPVASASLPTILPEKYTIIDVNALEALGVDDKWKGQAVYYLAYLKKCRELAAQFNVSFGAMDHALWQWGYEN
jgi:thermostable 8-oxoguanine DNA glycosylase